MYKGRFIHTVQPEDVGCGYSAPTRGTISRGDYVMPLRLFNGSSNPIYKAHPRMFEPLGRVLKQDTGKQIWLCDDVYCVESAEQRDERVKEVAGIL